ncbi:MAG: hypothetical protein Q9170_005626, partial [Blastenia crenularia]
MFEQAERNLCTALDDQNSTNLKFEPSVQEYRSACQNLILDEFENACSQNTEGKLWDVHVQINGRFRNRLGYFRSLKGKKKPVEERKTAKLYLNFIKSSQRHYRGYIQELASHFGGISEIETIAGRFRSDATTVSERKLQTSPTVRSALLQSCHRTLIHLGDLSRYRESEIDARKKEKNWGPALGYYDLATAIYPPSGIPYNQLAIISKSEGDHARTLYHLYRAQSAFESPPTAFANLELEFKKIREAWERGDLAVDDSAAESPLSRLQSRLPLLHSRCFDGIDLEEFVIIEKDVLQQLATGLKERSLETSFVNRMILSNIAGDFVAGDRWQEAPEEVRNELAFKLFQRLNVQTFSVLLQLFQAERQSRATTESSADSTGILSPVVRRLLPSLRYCQYWLLSRAALLSAHLEEPKMQSLLQQFWTHYIEVLTVILSNIRFDDLPRLEYLLEEDGETIGFRPLQEDNLQQKYLTPNSTFRKPKCHEQGVKRHHPNIEMLCRLRDFVEDAIQLAHSEFVPIQFVSDTGRFVLDDTWTGLEPSQTPVDSQARYVKVPSQKSNISRPDDIFPLDAESTTDDAASQGASVPLSRSTTMNQMVDDLVGPEPSNNTAPLLSTPPAPTLPSALENGANETSYGVGNSTLIALDSVNRIRSWSPKTEPQGIPNPTLPSIMNSPFAPRPEEEPVLCRSPATKRVTPTHSPQQSQQGLPYATIEPASSSMLELTQSSSIVNARMHPLLRKQLRSCYRLDTTERSRLNGDLLDTTNIQDRYIDDPGYRKIESLVSPLRNLVGKANMISVQSLSISSLLGYQSWRIVSVPINHSVMFKRRESLQALLVVETLKTPAAMLEEDYALE